MSQLYQDGAVYVQSPCFGFPIESDPNLKEPYLELYPSFSHGSCSSQAYILRDFECEGEDIRGIKPLITREVIS
jgi:hypothetical protein